VTDRKTRGAVAEWLGKGPQNLFGGSIPPRASIFIEICRSQKEIGQIDDRAGLTDASLQ
jgi:hypothetical protein